MESPAPVRTEGMRRDMRRFAVTFLITLGGGIALLRFFGVPASVVVEREENAVQCGTDACSGLATQLIGQRRDGFLLPSGEMLCVGEYSGLGPLRFGWARFTSYGGRSEDPIWCFLGCNGDIARVRRAYSVSDFSDGMALYEVTSGLLGISYKYGYLDSDLNVIPAKFDAARDFHEGLAAVNRGASNWNRGAVRGGKWGYIDRSGQFVIKPKFLSAYDFSEGLAVASTGAKDGYIDRSGNWVIEPVFWFAREFSEGRAPVSTDRGWAYIGRDGQFAFDKQFYNALTFSEGLAAAADSETELYGYINCDGDWVIQPKYCTARPFSQGRAAVARRVELIGTWTSKWGYIDSNDRVVVPLEYSSAKPFENGIGLVYEEIDASHSRRIYFDLDGKRIEPH
ncbi:MAG: WG repeat-containing protein [Planctomycetes bacterium]|nr:WG repeat-containing protein [Planctomycetota bacterium]